MHVEDATIILSPIRHNINAYHSENNKCGGNSSMVILDNRHLCGNIIPDNKDRRIDKIHKSIYSFLSSLQIGGD